ncbi:MAG: DUF58 domain-containing protein [Gammaproteobacteria bacterium]
MRASARDPWQRPLIKVYHQTSAIPVYAVADLSASMAFGGKQRKLDVLAEFVASLAYSAYHAGDPVGFISCAPTAFATTIGCRRAMSRQPSRRWPSACAATLLAGGIRAG